MNKSNIEFARDLACSMADIIRGKNRPIMSNIAKVYEEYVNGVLYDTYKIEEVNTYSLTKAPNDDYCILSVFETDDKVDKPLCLQDNVMLNGNGIHITTINDPGDDMEHYVAACINIIKTVCNPCESPTTTAAIVYIIKYAFDSISYMTDSLIASALKESLNTGDSTDIFIKATYKMKAINNPLGNTIYIPSCIAEAQKEIEEAKNEDLRKRKANK